MNNRLSFEINDYQVTCQLFVIPVSDERLVTYEISCPDDRTVMGQKYVGSFDEKHLNEVFKQSINQILGLPELDDGKQSKIFYDLVEEIWSSIENYIRFDNEYINCHYNKHDINEFFDNNIVQHYISKGLIDILDDPDEDHFAIEAYGGLGSEFIQISD